MQSRQRLKGFVTLVVGALSTAVAPSLVFAAGGTGVEQVASAPQRGTVVYRGTYAGEETTTSSDKRKPPRLREHSGALIVHMEFNGPAVEARVDATGTLRDFRVSGVREGTSCKLFGKTTKVSLIGKCTASEFAGVIERPDGDRVQLQIAYRAEAQKLVDEDERQRVAAAEKAEREKRLATEADVRRQQQLAEAEARKLEQAAELAKQEQILQSLPPATQTPGSKK